MSRTYAPRARPREGPNGPASPPVVSIPSPHAARGDCRARRDGDGAGTKGAPADPRRFAMKRNIKIATAVTVGALAIGGVLAVAR
ncbi:hypothetical protein SAMN05216533_1847 [Streptomyces sp. Ag109_O5-10]|nr:hypothetical protein SAMN05216533_1847 [Streptomyces sp. Ag109_O5-10]